MAGHSQFKNIMYRKGAQDARRAKQFAKLIRELTVAAKSGGTDINSNPRLRLAIASCRAANMPKDNWERALKKVEGGGDGQEFFEMRYEGYGPGGVALIVEALTDNRNRTASDVRAAFNKYGGTLGETNSVSFMFDRVGQVVFAGDAADADAMFEAALEAGADNVESEDGNHVVTCAVNDFAQVRETLSEAFGDPASAGLIWKPKSATPMDEDAARTLFKLMDVLDDHDDVQTVFANFEIADDIMEKLAS